MVDTLLHRKKSRFYGLMCTLALTGTLFLILWLIIIHTPNPPYPEAGGGAGNGIEVSLGFSEVEPVQPIEQSAPPVSTNQDEEIATQDLEEAPVIAEKTVEKATIKKNTSVKQVQTKTKPKSVVNTKALYPAQTKTDQTQGSPNGTLGAKAFGGQGGSGGMGGGTGGGVGSGTGTGSGPGISFNLSGRTPQAFPTPEYKQQVEGVVVVAVTVDKDGRVTQAEPGVKGSTTLDDGLLLAAKKAALQARFDRKPDAPAFQKGTITYRFRLQ